MLHCSQSLERERILLIPPSLVCCRLVHTNPHHGFHPSLFSSRFALVRPPSIQLLIHLQPTSPVMPTHAPIVSCVYVYIRKSRTKNVLKEGKTSIKGAFCLFSRQ